MSGKRKISIRKVIQTLVTLIVVTGCTMALISADRQQRNRRVKDVRIYLPNNKQVQFITEDAIREMLFTGRHLDPVNQKLNQLDVHSMESILQSNPWVREAQVYVDAQDRLHIIVRQRVPVVRVFQVNGDSYYLDTARRSMPVCPRFSSYVPVVTGAPKLGNDSAGDAVRGQIIGLVSYLSARSFWNAQVSQIAIRQDHDFELIPVLGSQRIILGDTNNLDEKLNNLFAFYKQVQNRLGWDQYRCIDLRYKGQVVASPALKWKVPVDRALSNVNWLKAIMESAPTRQDAGGDASAFADSVDRSAPRNEPRSPAVSATPKPATNVSRTQHSNNEKNSRDHAKNSTRHAAANR
jgi:cell division protein FtsQ